MSRGTLVFAIPGDPDQRSGGYLYDKRLAQELEANGWRVVRLGLPGSFPQPTPIDLAAAAAAFAGVPDGSVVLIDGLAFAAMPSIADAEAVRLRLVALVHHPVGLEAGLPADSAKLLLESERAALRFCRAVVVTSATTARTLARDFAVAAERITVAPPGTDHAPLAAGSGGDVPALLAVGAAIPRKGLDRLVAALAPLQHLAWRLEIAGSLERDRDAVAALRSAVAALTDPTRVRLLGELDADTLGRAYDRSDLFVSASSYEGYGMAVAEAIARGLPVVAVAGGALADWVDRGAALLVSPDEPEALTAAVSRVLTDPGTLRRLRLGTLAARERLPRWEDTGRIVAATLRGVAGA